MLQLNGLSIKKLEKNILPYYFSKLKFKNFSNKYVLKQYDLHFSILIIKLTTTKNPLSNTNLSYLLKYIKNTN